MRSLVAVLKHCVRRFKQKRAPTMYMQENLQMGVTVSEVKDYLDSG